MKLLFSSLAFVVVAALSANSSCRNRSVGVVSAFSSGAGGCASGVPAVSNFHLQESDDGRVISQIPFEESGVTFSIDGEVVVASVDTFAFASVVCHLHVFHSRTTLSWRPHSNRTRRRFRSCL